MCQGFVLALLDDDGAIWPATWDGLERVVDTYYAGDIANKMKKHWPTLRSHTWDHLETLENPASLQWKRKMAR